MKRETKKAIRILQEILEKTEDSEKQQSIEKDIEKLKTYLKGQSYKPAEIMLLHHVEKILKKYPES